MGPPILCSEINFFNSSFFWAMTRREVVRNRRFGTTCRSHLEGSSSCSLNRLTKMGRIGTPKTHISNYLTPYNNQEDGRIQFHRGGRLHSRNWIVLSFFPIIANSLHFQCMLCIEKYTSKIMHIVVNYLPRVLNFMLHVCRTNRLASSCATFVSLWWFRKNRNILSQNA